MKDITKSNPPLELIIKGGDPEKVAVWACSVCRLTRQSEEDAKLCCVPSTCDECGKEVKSYCEDCSKKKQQKKDQEAYDKAKKVKYADYDGQMLCCDCCDNYFWDLDAYLDGHDDDPDIRTWVWGTSQMQFSLDADSIIQHELESQEFYEDAYDSISGEAVKEMQSFFDGWKVKNPLNSYMEDRSVVVDLEEEVTAYLKERYSDDVPTDPGSSSASASGNDAQEPKK